MQEGVAGEETWYCKSWGSARLEGNSSGVMVVYSPKDTFHPQGEIQQCDAHEVSCDGLC